MQILKSFQERSRSPRQSRRNEWEDVSETNANEINMSETDRNDTDVETRQNLKAAGCSAKTIETFFSYQETEKKILLLERQRRELLDDVHDKERKIICLGYLMDRMNSGKEEF